MLIRPTLIVFCAAVIAACSSVAPTGNPEIRAVGEHFFSYEGSEIEIALGTGYAAGHVGEDFLLLGASFAGANGERMATVDRARISVNTPDRQTIPLMSQADFRDAYAKLNSAARLAEAFSPTVLDSTPTRRPCNEWFFRAPSDGLTRDVLTISSTEVCHGILYFHVLRGVQPGCWELEIELEETVVEIPFVLD